MLTDVRAFVDQATGLPKATGISATINNALFGVFPDCKDQAEAEALLASGNFTKEVSKGSNGSPFVRITKLPTAEQVTEIKTLLGAAKTRSQVLETMGLGVEF